MAFLIPRRTLLKPWSSLSLPVFVSFFSSDRESFELETSGFRGGLLRSDTVFFFYLRVDDDDEELDWVIIICFSSSWSFSGALMVVDT